MGELWECASTGKVHREGDKPASITIDDTTGVVTREHYTHQGKPHRADDKPCTIMRDQDTGNVAILRWAEYGEFKCLEDRGSMQVIDPETGVIACERFFTTDGMGYHRANGPAIIHRDRATAEVFREEFYINNRRRRDLERKHNAAHLREEISPEKK